VASPGSMGLLFLNPPYGHAVADKSNLADAKAGERIEMAILRRTLPLLATGGVLVLIVPHYVVDVEMATFLGRHLRELRFYMAPEQRFRQCVIFGVKVKAHQPSQAALQMFERGRAGELAEQVLPEVWVDPLYEVPSAADDKDLRFHAVRLDPTQLGEEIRRFRRTTLWDGFDMFYRQEALQRLRPLRDLSRWHLALALAAGQVTGLVKSPAGRILLIKGDTHKQKERRSSIEVDEKGNSSETVTLIDKFVPVINAIEFTPGRLGKVIVIR